MDEHEEPQRGARATDPLTSHLAAATAPTRWIERRILDTLRTLPDGATSSELTDLTGIQRVSVSPALRPLARDGYLVERGTRPGPSGRKQIVWSLV